MVLFFIRYHLHNTIGNVVAQKNFNETRLNVTLEDSNLIVCETYGICVIKFDTALLSAQMRNLQ